MSRTFKGVYFCLKITKKYLNVFSLLFAFSLVFGVISNSLVSYAKVSDLMIRTSSNALMTMELDDSDYSISPFSTLGTVTNTISGDGLPRVAIVYIDSDGVSRTRYVTAQRNDDDRFEFSFLPVNGKITTLNFYLSKMYNVLPSPGTYDLSFDFTSDFAYEYSSGSLRATDSQENVSDKTIINALNDNFAWFSGDIYISPITVRLGSIESLYLRCVIPQSQNLNQVAGSFSWRFARSDEEPEYSFGVDTSGSDYQSGVSSSLSDLSSSVDTMTDEISGVTEAIQNLQGAMEPHYDNVLTQMHHITEQLHAFWDQLYNMFYLPQYARLGDILDAIKDMDTGLGGIVSDTSGAIQLKLQEVKEGISNKLQSVQDAITGGYDNSGMESDKSELDDAITQYEQAEDELFEDAKGYINDFEFDTPFDAFTGPLSDISYFLSGMFSALGPMNVVITFSLTLTIAMVMIGWYRFKGGR